VVRTQPQICINYFRTWFCIDIVSAVPFDLIALVGSDADTGGVDKTAKLKLMRTIRLLRLLKLTRILRASRIMRRWRNKVHMSFAAREIVQLLMMLVLMIHWIACTW
jgi:hypothetical protein